MRAPFFHSVAALKGFEVAAALKGLSLVDDADVGAAARLKMVDGEKGVLVPGPPAQDVLASFLPGI